MKAADRKRVARILRATITDKATPWATIRDAVAAEVTVSNWLEVRGELQALLNANEVERLPDVHKEEYRRRADPLDVWAYAVPVERTVGGKVERRELINQAPRITLGQRDYGWRIVGRARPLNRAEWEKAVEASNAMQPFVPDSLPEGTRAEMMTFIHKVWNSPKAGKAKMLAIWAESDGYGEPGYIPPQGYDWSGIRDSSDAAVKRMYLAAAGIKDDAVPASCFRGA